MARDWYDSAVPEDAATAPREIDVSVVQPARAHAPALRRTRAGADALVAAGSQRSRDLVLRLRGRRAETLPG